MANDKLQINFNPPSHTDLGEMAEPMSKKRIMKWGRWLFLLFIFLNCMPYVRKEEKENLVRVALLANVEQINISGIKDNEFYDDYQVKLSNQLPLVITPYQGFVKVNGTLYHGYLNIQNISGKLWVINILGIEDYLKGVVPCEIGKISKNLIEAAKAQAVAARTYTYSHLNQYRALGFDLYATIQDQVYNGFAAENELTNTAIKETAGEILVFKKKPIDAKYHSTCGGRTADFNDAWPGKAPPYLKSVNCVYCKDSPQYQWTKKSSRKDFFLNLRSNLAKIGINLAGTERVKNFKLIKNKKSKRVTKIIIITTQNQYPIETYNIRKVLGDERDPGGALKSNYITLKTEKDSVIIEGRGYGHGVGMCQFGALEMARRGKNYKEILYHYYPGTRIKRNKS